VVDVRAELLAALARAGHELQRAPEECQRFGDLRQLVAADADAEEDVGALDVAERLLVGQRARLLEQRERLVDLSLLAVRPRFSDERAEGERGYRGEPGNGGGGPERVDRLPVVVLLRQPLRALEQGLGAHRVARADAVLQEGPVCPELCGEPVEGLRAGPCLAALDLADVLLGEVAACQLGLCQLRSRAQGPNAVADARRGRGVRSALREQLRSPQPHRFGHRSQVWTRKAGGG
jgi:hypothetical protein